jgi:hypothetical protein
VTHVFLVLAMAKESQNSFKKWLSRKLLAGAKKRGMIS